MNYPDNTTISKECVLNGNIWIGTVEGCATSGTSTNGFIVTASGIDENENVITNYVLGAGDLYVKDLDGTIDPDRTGQKMYFNDTIPTNPKKGDATFIDGVLNVYDGTNWTPVAEDPDLSNYYTKTEVDEALGEVEESIPTKTSDLTNDSGFITSAEIEPYHNPLTPTVNTGIANMAYSLALYNTHDGNPIADSKFLAQYTTDSDLTDKFSAGFSLNTYWPYKMTLYGEQTYDPELELKFCRDNLSFMSPRGPRQVYSGWMFRTAGVGYAIPCSEDGTPAGTLYETTEVRADTVLVSSRTPHTIGFTSYGNDPYGHITSLDG